MDEIISLFYGEDVINLKRELADCLQELMSEATEFDLMRINGQFATVGDILGPAMTLPFMSPYRLVIVEDLSLNNNGEAIISELAEKIPQLPGSTRLFFVEGDAGPERVGDSAADLSCRKKRLKYVSALSKAVEKSQIGRIHHFPIPSDTGGLMKWMSDRASEQGVSIESSAARALIDRIQEDLLLANGEITKLATFVGEGGVIRLSDVDALTPYSADASIFELVDSLGSRDGARALVLLHRLLDAGDDPLRIFGMIVRQYRLLIQIRELTDEYHSPQAAGEIIGLKGFVAEKIARQARAYPSLSYLEKIYEHLAGVDVQMKTGRIEPRLALERLISALDRG